MKRPLLFVFCMVLIFVMVLSPAGSAIAAPLNGGPSISAPSGGGAVTLTAIPVAKLPGTTTNAVGTIFPQGHESGDLKFSGDGAGISGLVGFATLSMPLADYASGWTGSIYQWLNQSWVAIPTTITQNEEGPNAIASATIYSDGIYALIIGYIHPVDENAGKCKSFEFVDLYGGFDPPSGIGFEGAVIIGKFEPADYADDRPIPFRVISLDPSVTLEGDVTGYFVVDAYKDLGNGLHAFRLYTPDRAYITHDAETGNPPVIVRITIEGCKLDYLIENAPA